MINEIQERLSPEHLVDQVKETVREATIGKVERVMERVRETISGVTEPAREVAVGLVLPSTRMESEYIGATGERLVDRVEDVARQMAPEGQQPPA